MKSAVAVAKSISRQEALAAVFRRDPAFNGRFVYAVRTSGVYCLAACPSRRPKVENIEIFSGPVAAKAGGYRACKRCRPDDFARQSRAEQAVWSALDYIEQNSEESITLAELAAETGLSSFYLQRSFKQILGLTPKQYLDKKRIHLFKNRLRDGDDVLGASLGVGFNTLREAYQKSARQLGMTPGEYRRGGRGLRIVYTTFASPLGLVLVANAGRGICALLLGASLAELESELRVEFPSAELRRDDRAMRAEARSLRDYLRGRSAAADLSIEIIGGEFQRRVWDALRSIPFGQTRSYQQVAEMIGQPKAVRAVARACASNRIALLIPCHRVLRADGSLAGYRWKAERKQQLLALEAQALKKSAGDESRRTSRLR